MQELDLPELETIQIPDKTHFKIGEVAKLLDLEPYVLRYWEKEFEVLEPSKTDSGQRAYQRDDIELLACIRKLLYTEMFTIDGARRQLELAKEGRFSYLTASSESAGEQSDTATSEALEEVQWENEQLRLELEQTEEEYADEHDRLRERIDQLEGALEQAREAGASDDEELREIRAENDKLRSEIETLQARLEELEAENDDLRSRDVKLDGEQRDLVEALQGEVAALAEMAHN